MENNFGSQGTWSENLQNDSLKRINFSQGKKKKEDEVDEDDDDGVRISVSQDRVTATLCIY